MGGLFLGVGLLLTKKRNGIATRRQLRILIIGAIVLISISVFFPIENTFLTFSSPQTSYAYNHLGKVELVVDGEKTSFVVAKKDDGDAYAMIPKCKNGWKLGMGFRTNRVLRKLDDGIVIYVYQDSNTEDAYLTVQDMDGNPIEIADSFGSKFASTEQFYGALDRTFYTYYAYIRDFKGQYTLTVNGKTIQIQR